MILQPGQEADEHAFPDMTGIRTVRLDLLEEPFRCRLVSHTLGYSGAIPKFTAPSENAAPTGTTGEFRLLGRARRRRNEARDKRLPPAVRGF